MENSNLTMRDQAVKELAEIEKASGGNDDSEEFKKTISKLRSLIEEAPAATEFIVGFDTDVLWEAGIALPIVYNETRKKFYSASKEGEDPGEDFDERHFRNLIEARVCTPVQIPVSYRKHCVVAYVHYEVFEKANFKTVLKIPWRPISSIRPEYRASLPRHAEGAKVDWDRLEKNGGWWWRQATASRAKIQFNELTWVLMAKIQQALGDFYWGDNYAALYEAEKISELGFATAQDPAQREIFYIFLGVALIRRNDYKRLRKLYTFLTMEIVGLDWSDYLHTVETAEKSLMRSDGRDKVMVFGADMAEFFGIVDYKGHR